MKFIMYTDELLKEFLNYEKFYSQYYGSIDELEKQLKFRTRMLFDIISYLNKQFGELFLKDIECLHQNKDIENVCEHEYRVVFLKLVDFFKVKYNIYDILTHERFIQYYEDLIDITAVVSTQTELHVKNQGNAKLWLEADTDNNGVGDP